MVIIYIAFVILHTFWQSITEVIRVTEAMSVLAVYLLPVIFYLYFRRDVPEQEIRSFLLAIAIAGAIDGLYFAYDSYSKLALGQISDYAIAAFQYAVDRAPTRLGEANDARVNLGSRSSGLLQSHTISGSWIILGAAATLVLVPHTSRFLRKVLIFLFASMLFAGQNFSSIVAAIIIVGVFCLAPPFSRHGISLPKLVIRVMALFFWLAIIAITALWMGDAPIFARLSEIALLQADILFSLKDGNGSMAGLAIGTFASYLRHILTSPLTLIVGDGFSSSGFEKGGDIGAIETLAQFGLPVYFAILVGFLHIIRTGLRRLKSCRYNLGRSKKDFNDSPPIQFVISVLLLVLIMDLHYSIWSAKSILPIIFFALALVGRYLYMPKRKGQLQLTRT